MRAGDRERLGTGHSCAFQLVNPSVNRCGLQGAEWTGPHAPRAEQREEVTCSTAVRSKTGHISFTALLQYALYAPAV